MLKVNQELEKIITRKLVKDGICKKDDLCVSVQYSGQPVLKFCDTYSTKEGRMRRVKYCFRTQAIPEKTIQAIKRNIKRYCNENRLTYTENVSFSYLATSCIAVRSFK